MAEKPQPELWGTSEKCNRGFLNAKFFGLRGENASAPRNLQDFDVLRGARRTLRTAHPITSSLSDAASNFASLPALHSTEAAFCRLRGLFGFFFRPGKEIFPLAASTACSELHDRQARDYLEVANIDRDHGIA